MLSQKIFLLVLLCFFNLVSFGQNSQSYSTKKKKAISLFEQSEPYLIRGQFPKAIQLLQQALDKDDNFAEAHLRIGSLYKDVGNFDRTVYHLKRAVEILPEDSRTSAAYYSLGESYFQAGQYENAGNYINTFLNVSKADNKLLAEARLLQSHIAFSKDAIKRPLPFQPKVLSAPLNRYQLQYFPVLTADKQSLIFTRREGLAQQYDEDIVISRKDSNGNWEDPESISRAVNTSDNEGTTAISADGRMLIFTSCLGRGGFGSCDLFVSYKTGGEWSKPKNLGPEVNGSSWESQPSLSADGRTLYFVSDRPGGLGKRDIWRSHNKEGRWTKAQNLGDAINTPYDEVSPFIHVNGQTLYFASKGHPGFGGFDLFSSSKMDEGWAEPKNLGYPLNNNADQVSLFITADGKTGYYSYEENYRTQNYRSILLTFDIPTEIQEENKSNYVKGKVYNSESKKPLKAQIELIDILKDELIGKVSSDSLTGEYLMVLTEGSEYALYVSKPGYLFKSLAFDYKEKADQEAINIDILLDPIRKGIKTTLENLFFDTDDYTLHSKSKTELQKVISFLNENPSLRIKIGGHTDDIGSDSYNQSLSEKRAKAVFDFLVEKGISPKKIAYEGYGETLPLVPNNSEANRQLNRRIEFEIK